MKREHLIALLRVAGYHDDAAAYTRLLVENRISYGKAKAAYAEGVKARENGVPCACQTCKTERARAGANARQSSMSANFGHPPGDRTAALRASLKARPDRERGPPPRHRTRASPRTARRDVHPHRDRAARPRTDQLRPARRVRAARR